MTEHEESGEALRLAFEYIKALHATLAALMTDVAALRHVVLQGPRTSRQYRQALAIKVAKAKPLVSAAMQAYEDEIVRIKSINDWRN
jgi:hypothetical protein